MNNYKVIQSTCADFKSLQLSIKIDEVISPNPVEKVKHRN